MYCTELGHVILPLSEQCGNAPIRQWLNISSSGDGVLSRALLSLLPSSSAAASCLAAARHR